MDETTLSTSVWYQPTPVDEHGLPTTAWGWQVLIAREIDRLRAKEDAMRFAEQTTAHDEGGQT